MTKSRDPNSKRSKKREARDFAPSRPVRRALRRLAYATASYKPSDPGMRCPGSLKHW